MGIKININPLFGMPSPRYNRPALQCVRDQWQLIPHDKYIVTHKAEIPALNEIREYFLQHEEYTHLVICPDDLIITPHVVSKLINDIRAKDYQVISGTCNLHFDETQGLEGITNLAICKDRLSVTNIENLKHLWMKLEEAITYTEPTQCHFNGLACCFIRRDVIEDIEFDGIGDNTNEKCGSDVVLGWDCEELGITMYVDTHAFMWHLKMLFDCSVAVNLSRPESKSFLVKGNNYGNNTC